MSISRRIERVDVTIASGAALSEAIDYSIFSGGFIFTPAAWTAADIGFQVNYVRGGTFVNALDTAGALVEVTGVVAAKAFAIPADLFGAAYFKLWSQSGGAGQNQGADRALILILKS